MSERAYVSNISPAWTIEQQAQYLASRVPLWAAVPVYSDSLRSRALRDRNPDALVQRAVLTKPTARSDGGTVHVATLAILAWRAADFRHVLELLATRHDNLMAHEEGRLFDLQRQDEIEAAVAMFPQSRTHSGRRKGRLVGAQASAAKRNALSKAAADKIRDRWGAPGETATALVAETGYTYHTIVRWLGKWEPARRRRERNAKQQWRRKHDDYDFGGL